MSSSVQDALEAGAGEMDEDAVRTAFDVLVTADGRSLLKIAPETGVAYATLSAWRNGTYAGNNANVLQKVRTFLLTREAAERTRSTLPTAPGFLHTPTANRIWELAEFAQTMPAIAVAAGGAGIGKTMAVLAYQARVSNVWIATMEPVARRIGGMLDRICMAVGDERPYRSAEMSSVIQHRVRNTRGLLVLDDAQQLSPESLDQVRTIHDKASVGVLLVGNETIYENLGISRPSRRYAQLTSRIGLKLTRPNPVKGDIEMLLDGWQVDDADARALGMKIARLPGALRQLTQVMRLAGALAAQDCVPKPGAAHIQNALNQLTGGMQ